MCLTTTDRFEGGVLQHPPIDHVCAAPGRGRTLASEVRGWDSVVDGVRLSDHGGVLATLRISEGSPQAEPARTSSTRGR